MSEPTLVECVPNFSEGRDEGVIDAIVEAIGRVAGARVLHVDAGRSANRTVVSFVAPPSSVVEAAYAGIARATELIDMRQHRGVHPRMGATDVCPLVPLRGVDFARCVELAHQLGRDVGQRLDTSVYLYGEAATSPRRRELSTVRSGEYEGLATKLVDPQWRPDYGPTTLNPKSGALAIGVRGLLIAYNVNLATRDPKVARRIARAVRERGRVLRDERGERMRDACGRVVREPGLAACRAAGWYIAEYDRAQVTMNLLDYRVTPPHVAFARVSELAVAEGTRVTGSEVVGLVPVDALLTAGRDFRRARGDDSADVRAAQLVEDARVGLGLSDVVPFDPSVKILERLLDDGDSQGTGGYLPSSRTTT